VVLLVVLEHCTDPFHVSIGNNGDVYPHGRQQQ
jgi:hypothetical protein